MVKIHPQSNGPQLPPPRPPPPPHRRNLCPFLFQLCFFLVVASLSALLIVVVVLSIVFGSRREVAVFVTDASLTNFELKTIRDGSSSSTTTTFTLSYDMSFDFNLTNPNAGIAVYYDTFRACAYYTTTPVSVVSLAPFDQGHKTTKSLRVVFQGNETLSFEGSDGEFLTAYDEEKRGGVYSITVVVNLSVRTKYGKIKFRQNQNYIYCYLRVPLSSKETKLSSYTFQVTQCPIVHIIT